MKVINTTGAYQVFQAYGAKKPKALEASKTVETSKIGIEISATAKLFSFAMEEAKKNSLGRDEKVNNIKKDIEEGKYKIDFQKLSESMMG